MLNPAISAINHLLASASWARQALAGHAGKSARLSLPPFDLDILVLPDGTVSGAKSLPETRIRTNPAALVKTLKGEMAAVEMTGDMDFAKTLSYLFRNLKWDAEEDLSGIVGDIAAHRIVGAGKTLFSWQKEAALRLLENFAEYWTEEQPLIARAEDVARHLVEVDDLRDGAERLEKRIAKLESIT